MAKFDLEELQRQRTATVQEINVALHEWQGVIAEWYHFQVSLALFVLRLKRLHQEEELYLIAGDCRFIGGPTYWHNAHIQAEHLGTSDEYFLVSDPSSEFKVSCGYLNMVNTKRDIERFLGVST